MAKEEISRLEKIDALYTITIDACLKLALEADSKLGTISAALPRIKTILDAERNDMGIHVDRNLLVEFTDTPAVLDEEKDNEQDTIADLD